MVKSRLSVLSGWVKKELLSYRFTYLLLFLILLLSAFLRLYKLDQLLGFWYDQGRDALVIWDLLHYKKLFLIGPVTGIEGIFLGPFYYYLIAPFYWLGRGSPVFVAAFLGWLSVGTVFLAYFLAKQIFNKEAGLLAAFFYGFSYEAVIFSRWLANPNPLPFFTLLALIFFWFSLKKDAKYLIYASFIIGLCLQLEAAAAFFFLPAALVIVVWQRKKLLKPKLLFFSLGSFFITLLPQIVFNFRHQGILVQAFKRFLFSEKSFQLALLETVQKRLWLYYEVFSNKVFPSSKSLWPVSLAIFLGSLLIFKKRIFVKEGKLLLIWLLSPLFGFLFYQGNFGYVWDYYFSGVYPVFLILFASGIYFLAQKKWWGKIILVVFLGLFLKDNLIRLKNYLKTGIGITLQAQTKAIDWVYKETGRQEFNIDAYVPPQIYFSYSYLFRWYGKQKYGFEPETKLVGSLYTVYEPDSEHPQFLEAWLKRQEGIGKIVKDHFWGDITVQKRERIDFE